MERGHYGHFTYHDRYATVWFVNGRVFPDLFQGDYNPLFPNQPYESLAQAHPGDKVLVRAVNVGQDSHPFHFHGENLRFIGRDGRHAVVATAWCADLGRIGQHPQLGPQADRGHASGPGPARTWAGTSTGTADGRLLRLEQQHGDDAIPG